MKVTFASAALLSLGAIADNSTQYETGRMNVFGSDFGEIEYWTDWSKDASGQTVMEFNVSMTKNNLYNSLSTTKQLRTWFAKKDFAD